MQLFFRGGAQSSTVALCCSPDDNIEDLKQRLFSIVPDFGPPASMVMTFSGRVLNGTSQVCNTKLRAGNTVHVCAKLLGGGGDGGSTGAESRSCYLEMYMGKKPDKVNPAEEAFARWTRCYLTGAELQPPCVVDELGNLYNKDSILQALLTKALPKHLSFISGLKSVTELKLVKNPHYKGDQPKAATRGSDQPGNEARFHCPVTGLEWNGRFKFVVHRATGHAVAEKALKELPTVVEELLGSKPSADDWIPVNPPADQLEPLKEKVAAKMAAEREKKAAKKAAKMNASLVNASENGNASSSSAAAASNGKSCSPPRDQADDVAVNGKKRASPPAAAPVNGAAAGKALPGDGVEQPATKKAKALDVMPKNSSSSIYASLFTSSLKEAPKESYMCRSTSARGMHLG